MLLIAVVFFFLLGDVSARMCYECKGLECSSGNGRTVDCGNGSCDMKIDVSANVVVAPGKVKERYCGSPAWTVNEGYACVDIGNPGHMDEVCSCDQELCNGDLPPCKDRAFHIDEIKAVLPEDCKDWLREREKNCDSSCYAPPDPPPSNEEI